MLTTRGLEDVAARELQALPGVAIRTTAYRRVAATCDEALEPLLALRTVDDVFVDVATWQAVGRPRSTLVSLREHSSQLDLRDAAAACGELRPLATPPTFSVTASFVGRRNYTTEEIKDAIAAGIETSHGWEYLQDDAESDLNLRIFIEHAVAFVGVRLSRSPLHMRPYKQSHVGGSLKPPVAAAMVLLTEATLGQRLLDPCCGAGTILIEAALLGHRAGGGDNDAEAIVAAQVNARAAAVDIQLEQWDAQQLPLDAGVIDHIACNLPWGRQIVVDTALTTFYRNAVEEMRRVLIPGGRIVLLTGSPELVPRSGLEIIEQREISLFGQTPSILVLTKS